MLATVPASDICRRGRGAERDRKSTHEPLEHKEVISGDRRGDCHVVLERELGRTGGAIEEWHSFLGYIDAEKVFDGMGASGSHWSPRAGCLVDRRACAYTCALGIGGCYALVGGN